MSTMKRILLVEDDRSLGETLKEKLAQTYAVDWASSQGSALQLLNDKTWDLVILDINLPDGNGFNIAKAIQNSRAARPPFIFLTARGDAETRLAGYELGADEFIPKPFHLKELLMRVKHVLEAHVTSPDEIRIESAVINFTNLSVRRNQGAIEYPSTTDMKILKLLIEQSPKPVSRDEIINSVWGIDKDVSHRTIDNAVVRIRQTLGSSGEKVIRSVRSVGYQWLPEGSENE